MFDSLTMVEKCRQIEEAFFYELEISPDPNVMAFKEHEQFWIIHMPTGVIWSANKANTESGWCFEIVQESGQLPQDYYEKENRKYFEEMYQ